MMGSIVAADDAELRGAADVEHERHRVGGHLHLGDLDLALDADALDRVVAGAQAEAEVQQVLGLVINSLYTHKEVFLRELISNASDALDKLRFEGLSDSALYENDPDLKIRIAFDREARTLTITDNGIGMSRDEVVQQLGTIARSGTAEFLRRLSGNDREDVNLIGQFGVGFYSAFIVAERVAHA